MTSYVFGIGLGSFLLCLFWICGIIAFCISLQTRNKIGFAIVGCIILLTIILCNLPLQPEVPEEIIQKEYDYQFVWRVSILVIVVLSAIISAIFTLKICWMEEVHPRLLNEWIVQ